MQKPGNRRKTEVHSNQNRLKEVVHSALNPVDLIHQLRFSLEQEWKSKNIPYTLPLRGLYFPKNSSGLFIKILHEINIEFVKKNYRSSCEIDSRLDWLRCVLTD